MYKSQCRKRNILNQKRKQQRQNQHRLHRFQAATDASVGTSQRTWKLRCKITRRRPSKNQHQSLSKGQTDSRSIDKATKQTSTCHVLNWVKWCSVSKLSVIYDQSISLKTVNKELFPFSKLKHVANYYCWIYCEFQIIDNCADLSKQFNNGEKTCKSP